LIANGTAPARLSANAAGPVEKPTAMPYHDSVAGRGDAGFAEPDSLSPWLQFRFKSS